MAFLDTIKALGIEVKDAGVETAKDIGTAAAEATKGAIVDAIRNVGKPKTTAPGAVKQPPAGKNADGTPVVVLPSDTKVNSSGQVVIASPGQSPGQTVPPWVWVAGGGFLLLVGGLITYKVVAG